MSVLHEIILTVKIMIRLELTFSNNPYRIEINCNANQLTGFYMTQFLWKDVSEQTI